MWLATRPQLAVEALVSEALGSHAAVSLRSALSCPGLLWKAWLASQPLSAPDLCLHLARHMDIAPSEDPDRDGISFATPRSVGSQESKVSFPGTFGIAGRVAGSKGGPGPRGK